jgi:hypothetical protein
MSAVTRIHVDESAGFARAEGANGGK